MKNTIDKRPFMCSSGQPTSAVSVVTRLTGFVSPPVSKRELFRFPYIQITYSNVLLYARSVCTDVRSVTLTYTEYSQEHWTPLDSWTWSGSQCWKITRKMWGNLKGTEFYLADFDIDNRFRPRRLGVLGRQKRSLSLFLSSSQARCFKWETSENAKRSNLFSSGKGGG